jgi:cytochrome b561
MNTKSLAASAPVGATAYDRSGKAFHWKVVVLVACRFITALLLPHTSSSTLRSLR